jgi:excisionase family DNA binding protein
MKELVTVKQAASKACVSASLVYEWCQSGSLPHYRFGRPGKRGKILIDEADLQGFLAGCRRYGPVETDEPLKQIR